MGYETHNTILNLGTVWVLGALLLVRYVFYFICVFIKWVSRGHFKFNFLNSMRDQLFYSELLVLVTEPYFELLISGYLSMNGGLETNPAEVVGYRSG